MPREEKAALLIALLLTSLCASTSLFLNEEQVTIASANESISPDRYNVTLLRERMPLDLTYGSAAYDGTNIYIFGGFTSGYTSGTILRFDPNTSQVTALLDSLPSPRGRTAAVYCNNTVYNVGKRIYILGGWSPWYNVSGEVVRFYGEFSDMVHDAIPPTWDMSAVCIDNVTYIFGGVSDDYYGESLDRIVKCPLPNGPGEVLQARLPISRGGTSAVWDGNNAYIFGGWTGNSTTRFLLDDIVRFNPETNEVANMSARFSSGRAFTSAVWNGRYAYIFGGRSNFPNGTGVNLDEIIRYDPSIDVLETLPAQLPYGSEGAYAVWAGSATYVFGGADVFHGTNPRNGIVKMMITTEQTPEPQPYWVYGLAAALVCIGLISVYIGMKRRQART